MQCFSSGSSYDGSAAQRYEHLPTLPTYKYALIRNFGGVPLSTLDGLAWLRGGSVHQSSTEAVYAGYPEEAETDGQRCCCPSPVLEHVQHGICI